MLIDLIVWFFIINVPIVIVLGLIRLAWYFAFEYESDAAYARRQQRTRETIRHALIHKTDLFPRHKAACAKERGDGESTAS